MSIHAGRAGISGFHHVALRVADLERSLALYRDTLGLTVKTRFVFNGRRFALVDAGNRGYLELIEVKEPIQGERPDDVLWHIALRTSELDRVLAAVETAGYVVTTHATRLDVMDTQTGTPLAVRFAFFSGPDGESVELFEDGEEHT